VNRDSDSLVKSNTAVT